jgi:branched-chain amino acid transport system permease protein
VLTPLFFGTGYALQRFIIGPTAHGEDRGFLLVTLGLAVVIENTLLYFFRADTRTINLPYAFDVIEIGPAFVAVPRVIAFAAVIAVAIGLWAFMRWTDTGKAIRGERKTRRRTVRYQCCAYLWGDFWRRCGLRGDCRLSSYPDLLC